MRQRRAMKSRVHFRRQRTAADLVPPFEHERFQAGFGQVERRRERVVTSPDNDCIVHLHEILVFPCRRIHAEHCFSACTSVVWALVCLRRWRRPGTNARSFRAN